MMKENPIIFNGDMVSAILDGRKTQTRRPVKPQPNARIELCSYNGWSTTHNVNGCTCDGQYKSPFGSPGDRLWVRETFLLSTKGKPFYRASTNLPGAKWKPSIHMPRHASRITLEVVSVRVERLREISEEGAIAEGISRGKNKSVWWCDEVYQGVKDKSPISPTAKKAFEDLWDSIYAAKGTGWDANPWVWVVEFKRVG
jgi:hypothetical protein